MAGSGQQKDLYRSSYGGATFTPLGLPGKTPSNPYEDQLDMNIMAGQAFYNHMVLVDPADENRNTVYIGGQFSAAKSTDGGNTWRVVSAWLAQNGLPYVHADHHAAAIATIRGTPILLFGTDGGLFTSDDGGQTFSSQKNDAMASYLILGAGKFGRLAVARLSGQDPAARFAIVDQYPVALAAISPEYDAHLDKIQADVAEFVQEHLSDYAAWDWLIPMVPVHVAAIMLKQELAADGWEFMEVSTPGRRPASGPGSSW